MPDLMIRLSYRDSNPSFSSDHVSPIVGMQLHDWKRRKTGCD